jgi:hypothetical protein
MRNCLQPFLRSPLSDAAEQNRLDEAREGKAPWKKWGPYLSERQGGTVPR